MPWVMVTGPGRGRLGPMPLTVSWSCFRDVSLPAPGGSLGRDHPGAGAAGVCAGIFAELAVPVADQLTRGAFLRAWRLMSIDGSSGMSRIPR